MKLYQQYILEEELHQFFQLKNWEQYLIILKSYFNVEENCEITIELNPDDVNPDYLEGLKNT